ncbi:hypothetical protein, partial [Candidatus Hodarchaeum mangrovi]
MAPKQTQLSEDIKSELESTFIQEFLDFISKLQKYCFTSTHNAREVSKLLFKSHTLPFMNKWIKIPEFKHYFIWRTKYAKDYYSFGLLFEGSIMLFPHKLASKLIYDMDWKITDLKKKESIQDFLSTLWKVFDDSNLPLNNTDRKIILYYTDSAFCHHWKRFPSQKELAKAIDCEPKTISTRCGRLYDQYILTHTYLVKMAQLGYQTIAYLFDHEETISSYDEYCLGKLPFNLGLQKGMLQIYQIPYWKHFIFSKIQEDLNPLREFQLYSKYIGWHLSPIHKRPEKRWKIPPPILRENNWDDEIILDHSGLKMELTPNLDPVKLTVSQARLLNFYQIHGTTKEIQLAEYAGVNQDSITRLWREILKKEITLPISIVSNIG